MKSPKPKSTRCLTLANLDVVVHPVNGQLEHEGAKYVFGKGVVLLLPAVLGTCLCRPRSAMSLLEIPLPDAT